MMGDRDNFRDDFPYFSIKTCGPSFEPSWRDDSNDLVGILMSDHNMFLIRNKNSFSIIFKSSLKLELCLVFI